MKLWFYFWKNKITFQSEYIHLFYTSLSVTSCVWPEFGFSHSRAEQEMTAHAYRQEQVWNIIKPEFSCQLFTGGRACCGEIRAEVNIMATACFCSDLERMKWLCVSFSRHSLSVKLSSNHPLLTLITQYKHTHTFGVCFSSRLTERTSKTRRTVAYLQFRKNLICSFLQYWRIRDKRARSFLAINVFK